MGYYTDYSLEIEFPDEDTRQRLETLVLMQETSYGTTLRQLTEYAENMKWYDWEKEMIVISLDFPNVLFIMSGIGEDQPDMWRAWIRNGKSVRTEAKITYEEPDLDNMLPVVEKPKQIES